MPNDLPAPSTAADVEAPVSPVALDPAADPASWAPVETPGPRCPWCSAALPSTDLEHCPSCRAQLVGGVDAGVPGLTEVQPVQKAPPLEPVKRNRLLAWISGEVLDEVDPSPTAPDALAPPSRDVRREILRLQLEAAGIPVPTGDAPDTTTDLVAPGAATTVAPPTASDRESTAA